MFLTLACTNVVQMPKLFWDRGRVLHAQFKEARQIGKPLDKWTAARAAAKLFNRDIFAYGHKMRKKKKETAGASPSSPDNTSKKLLAALRLLNQLVLHQVCTYTVLRSRVLTLF